LVDVSNQRHVCCRCDESQTVAKPFQKRNSKARAGLRQEEWIALLKEHFVRGASRSARLEERCAQGKDKADRIYRIDGILLLQHFPDESAEGNPLARR